MDLSNVVIVSRHTGALDWLAQQWQGGDCRTTVERLATGVSILVEPVVDDPERYSGQPVSPSIRVPVITGNATAADVAGKTVIGNLPLSLAALAREVHAIEFDGAPLRGQDYSAADMAAAGARLARYVIFNESQAEDARRTLCYVSNGSYREVGDLKHDIPITSRDWD